MTRLTTSRAVPCWARGSRSLWMVLAAAALVGGCGGGSGSSPTPSSPPPPAPSSPPPPAPPPPAPPPTVAATPMVAAGSGFSLALKTDGTVSSWGDQGAGQLGNDVTAAVAQRVPQTVVNLSDAVRVAAGEFHAAALRSDGTVVAWGSNADGKLGIGTTGGIFPTPQPVAGLTEVTAIAAGLDHTLALRSDGSVWAWGRNDVGQLGQSVVLPRASPTRVPGLTDVTSIAAGGAHSLALRSDGSVWAWGWNGNGQLGAGQATAPVTSPIRITALDGRNVVELSGGGFHTLARTVTGAVLGWGSNTLGQTGTGIPGSGDVLTPTAIPGLAGVAGLAAGERHSVALLTDGTIRTWGNASAGRLGEGSNGATQSTSTPQVPNLSTVTAIAAGVNHTLAVLQDGRVACFGSNFTNQCGRIEITDLTTPMEVGPGFRVGP